MYKFKFSDKYIDQMETVEEVALFRLDKLSKISFVYDLLNDEIRAILFIANILGLDNEPKYRRIDQSRISDNIHLGKVSGQNGFLKTRYIFKENSKEGHIEFNHNLNDGRVINTFIPKYKWDLMLRKLKNLKEMHGKNIRHNSR
jgi:hypothetical protein